LLHCDADGGAGETGPGDELVDEPEEAGALLCLLIAVTDTNECPW